MDKISALPLTLLDLLSNSLVLHQCAPYLPVASALALAATSRLFRDLLYNAPELFRYLDLSGVKSAILPATPIDNGGISWRSERMDEALTPEEFYSGPLRGIFSHLTRLNALGNVQTLVLDGLSVPADMIQEIISDSRYNVRILSVREAQHLNPGKLRQVLKYAVRSSRPEGTPRLRGLYYFGPRDSSISLVPSSTGTPSSSRKASRRAPMIVDSGVMSSEGAQIGAQWNQRSQKALDESLKDSEDRWFQPSGRMFSKTPDAEWAETIRACEGIIAFDAVLCRGPRHDIACFIPLENIESPQQIWLTPAVATIALGPAGCAKCNSSEEGPAVFGVSPPHHLPLLSPPPLHSSSTGAAQRPSVTVNSQRYPLFIRCEECLRGRWCERCLKWWDERCYAPPAGNQRLPEVSDTTTVTSVVPDNIKIHMGLCTEYCLVSEMMSGAGSFGMWG